MNSPTRREVLAQTALAGAMAGLASPVLAAGPAPAVSAKPLPPTQAVWIDGAPPPLNAGQTWGVPWPQGAHPRKQAFRAKGADGSPVALQTWPIAYWPDGSLKWTAHAVGAGPLGASLTIEPGKPGPDAPGVRVTESSGAIEVSTGLATWRFPRDGSALIASATRGGREVLRNVRLVLQTQDAPEIDSAPVGRKTFESVVDKVTVEQNGPVRAVIRLEGRHKGGDRAWAPFIVRFYAYAGADSLRMMHTFIFDGDAAKDFVCGLGVTADVPMADELYDRHVRFTGQDSGLWAEAVKPLTGLRRDPGAAFRDAQIAGRKVPPADQMAAPVRAGLHLIPAWGDFLLSQPTADGFTIRKRTAPGHAWIHSDSGGRASGVAYVGGASGGAAIGLGNFWRAPPTALEIQGAAGEVARLTAWLWSPDAPVMETRFYHDGLGMETHAQETEGLNITYEDYEKDWGTPTGIARTTELRLWALDTTPARDAFPKMAQLNDKPPRLMATPERIHAANVLGAWSLPDRGTPQKARIEDRQDQLLNFYLGQIEQRRWYGFWDYGDVMHSYDVDRHVWRYDIGGFAWDNSELSTDLWLWLSYLRGGRADVFRMAEAMTRHTGEVDVYHVGPYRGLGTRHGVQHWGDSSKQPRVSNAIYRRIYYYLTADERVGDLMRDLVDGDEALTRVNIGRKLEDGAWPKGEIRASFGTDWSSLCGAWFTEWERTGDPRWRDRILAGMKSIAALQKQWFAGAATYDVKTGTFSGAGDKMSVGHLNAAFGAPEIHVEMLALIREPAYDKAWLDYCRWYNAPRADQIAQFGRPLGANGLRQGHSRLTAYAAWRLGDKALGERAWTEFFGRGVVEDLNLSTATKHFAGSDVLNPIDEAAGVTTNGTAQWGLAAIMNLALVPEALPTSGG
ncbi:Tat pathway signal sequence domain protein [Caulobacter sp. Root656]|nr:Tat pathway signal sequence domain protein [Caulobacter sp. Root656]